MPQLGWKAGTEQYPPVELLDHAVWARRYIELGFDHLIFHSAGPDQRAFVEGYGRDVLPRLRQRVT